MGSEFHDFFGPEWAVRSRHGRARRRHGEGRQKEARREFPLVDDRGGGGFTRPVRMGLPVALAH